MAAAVATTTTPLTLQAAGLRREARGYGKRDKGQGSDKWFIGDARTDRQTGGCAAAAQARPLLARAELAPSASCVSGAADTPPGPAQWRNCVPARLIRALIGPLHSHSVRDVAHFRSEPHPVGPASSSAPAPCRLHWLRPDK